MQDTNLFDSLNITLLVLALPVVQVEGLVDLGALMINDDGLPRHLAAVDHKLGEDYSAVSSDSQAETGLVVPTTTTIKGLAVIEQAATLTPQHRAQTTGTFRVAGMSS